MALNCAKRNLAYWCSTGKMIDPREFNIQLVKKEANCLALSNSTKGLALRNCTDKYLFLCEVCAKKYTSRENQKAKKSQFLHF
jgi:hypothetical protein